MLLSFARAGLMEPGRRPTRSVIRVVAAILDGLQILHVARIVTWAQRVTAYILAAFAVTIAIALTTAAAT
jgi:hypothetical protein